MCHKLTHSDIFSGKINRHDKVLHMAKQIAKNQTGRQRLNAIVPFPQSHHLTDVLRQDENDERKEDQSNGRRRPKELTQLGGKCSNHVRSRFNASSNAFVSRKNSLLYNSPVFN